ncbi:MAG: LysR family transcriptional regulator [Pseudomonadota bacterium]|nr:LysR family transcriptional regulator [Pseudomonadota bacterium]
MDAFKPYAVFAETVAAGSMSAAARRLGMTPSAVSQTIRALEQQAGVTLLHRSTRKLTLTEAGERCYPHCLRLLQAADAATDALALARDAPSGELRIAAPVGFAVHIAAALAPLLAESPRLRLSLLVDDALIDLIDARIDIAIRVGRLADSTAIARHLCDFEWIVCATPGYLERHGVPATPTDLAAHHWLGNARYTTDSATGADTLPVNMLHVTDAAGAAGTVAVSVRIGSNNQLSLQQMCEQGLGLARLGHADVAPLLKRGALVQVLPQWRFGSVPVNAVTQRREGEPVKVGAAIDVFKRYFSTL